MKTTRLFELDRLQDITILGNDFYEENNLSKIIENLNFKVKANLKNIKMQLVPVYKYNDVKIAIINIDNMEDIKDSLLDKLDSKGYKIGFWMDRSEGICLIPSDYNELSKTKLLINIYNMHSLKLKEFENLIEYIKEEEYKKNKNVKISLERYNKQEKRNKLLLELSKLF